MAAGLEAIASGSCTVVVALVKPAYLPAAGDSLDSPVGNGTVGTQGTE